jgi:hypothetical protein
VVKAGGRHQKAARSGKTGQPGRRRLTFSIPRPFLDKGRFCLDKGRQEGCQIDLPALAIPAGPAGNLGLGDCSPLAPQLCYWMIGKMLGTRPA